MNSDTRASRFVRTVLTPRSCRAGATSTTEALGAISAPSAHHGAANRGGRLHRLRSHRALRSLPGIGAGEARDGVVSVVPIRGLIADSTSPLPGSPMVNMGSLEKRLRLAFGKKDLRAVALIINSPGGSPTQSEYIGARIRQLKGEAEKRLDREVPVLAFAQDVMASGSYWIACAADEIFAARTSLVGSIGVISAGFGFVGLADKLGVERRVYTAGANKSRLDPFAPEKDEDVEWLHSLQNDTHSIFREWVLSRRGDKLTAAPEELFTGEVWLGDRAVERGLADRIGYFREVMEERFPTAEISIVQGKKTLAQRLGLAVTTPASDAITAVEHRVDTRAAYARYGL